LAGSQTLVQYDWLNHSGEMGRRAVANCAKKSVECAISQTVKCTAKSAAIIVGFTKKQLTGGLQTIQPKAVSAVGRSGCKKSWVQSVLTSL